MVRAFGFCVLFMMVGMAIMILAFSSSSSSYSFSDMAFHDSGNRKMATTHNDRKLKEKSSDTITEKKNKGNDKMNLEDYHPIDPAPSSKASIRYGPIEHGSPLIPYIPKPPRPDRPGLVPSPPAA